MTVELDLKQWDSLFKRALKKVHIKKYLVNRFADYMKKQTIRNFLLQGTRGGHERWQDLSPVIASMKKEAGLSLMPLLSSGALRDGFYYDSSKEGFEMKNKKPYFEKHELGNSSNAVVTYDKKRYTTIHGVPEREMLFYVDEDMTQLEKLSMDWLDKVVD